METFSDRLKFAIQRSSLNNAEVARIIDVRPQVIDYLCKFNPKNSKYSYLLSEALDINLTWLLTGKGTSEKEKGFMMIPFLNKEQIKALINNKEKLEYLVADKYIPADSTCNREHNFAFQLQDKSMDPVFPLGSKLIFNLKKNPKNNDFSLILSKKFDELLFRKINISDKNIIHINPINTELFSSSIATSEYSIIATLQESRIFFD